MHTDGGRIVAKPFHRHIHKMNEIRESSEHGADKTL